MSAARLGGRFTFPGTSLTVQRVGYGAMQLAGPGVWGPPRDPDGAVAVRNSRHPSGPALVYTRAEIAAFLAGVRDGEFDDLA